MSACLDSLIIRSNSCGNFVKARGSNMALQDKAHGEFDEDEDIEALRWAALQTLKQGISGTNVAPEASALGPFVPKKETSVGVPRRHARNDSYHRHRINSNLITIVPTMHVSSLDCQTRRTSLSGSNLQSRSSEPFRNKLAEDNQKQENKQVSTKFTRFDDSSEESSVEEESEDESSSSEEVCAKEDTEPDPDIIVMKDVDENSLDRLMDQLEQEMNEDGDNGTTGVLGGNSSANVDLENSDVQKNEDTRNDVKRDSKKIASKHSGSSGLKRLKKRGSEKEEVNSCSVEMKDASGSSPVNIIVSSKAYFGANVSSSREKPGNAVYQDPPHVLCSPVSKSSPKNLSPSINCYNLRSRSKSPSKSPNISKTSVGKSRKSGSMSPLPTLYYSSPRSPYHSRSPHISRSPYCSRSPRHSRTPCRSRTPRRSRSPCRTRSPRRSRSPCHSRTPRRSRSRHRSRSPFLSRSPRHSRSPRRSRSPHRSRSPRRLRSPLRPRSPRYSRSPRLSRSPRKIVSRSPALPRSPRTSRNSRSPVKSSRSPRRRYQSPIRYTNSSHSYVRNQGTCSPRRQSHSPRNRHQISPRRSVSLKHSASPRRSLSPRQSASPRSRRLSPRRPISPRRSPNTVRRQFSPRRQSLSPKFRRHSKSPISRRPHSPRNRRSVSPRRLSPVSFRKRFSPSPTRRNQSPVRRFSPNHRSPSMSRRRSSRSLSRSPRRRSPVRDRSPILPRSFPRSPSLRRRVSRSPVGRTGIRHSSPANRKLSPWSSPRQQSIAVSLSPGKSRYSKSPSCKRKSLSPYRRQKMRSNSPRSLHEKHLTHTRGQSRNEARLPQSPIREDLCKSMRESRSQSPQSSPLPDGRSIHNSRSPSLPSLRPKSSSSTPSLSLSSSPERNPANDSRRRKSPLRMTVSCIEFKTKSVGLEENGKERNAKSPSSDNLDLVLRKHSKNDYVNKESKSKYRKKIHNKGKDLVVQIMPVDKLEHTSQTASPLREDNRELPECDVSGDSVMEARRRKFESSEPVESSSKRIRLKPLKSKEITYENQSQTVSTTTEFQSNDDELDIMLDLELEKGIDFWSSEDSLSDNEGRFKSSDKRGATTGDTTKMGVLPYTKLLDPTVSSQTSAGNRETKGSRSKNKTSEEKSRRGTDRSSRGHKQRTRTKTSDSSACTKESREKKANDVYNRVVEGVSLEVTDKTTDSWNRQLEAKNLSDSKIKNDFTNVEHSRSEGERKCDKSVEHSRSKEGDLRAELSRRRAERLTKVGSVHEILPARLVRSAFKDAVGIKNFKKVNRNEKRDSSKKSESVKGTEKSDGRRVLVLKSTAVEHHIPSISVTIPKEGKHKEISSPLQKLPVRMRLGLPAVLGNERESASSRRRGGRKVKLKRNVTVTSGSSSGDKV